MASARLLSDAELRALGLTIGERISLRKAIAPKPAEGEEPKPSGSA